MHDDIHSDGSCHVTQLVQYCCCFQIQNTKEWVMNLAQILDGEKNQLVVKGILGGEEINWWLKGTVTGKKHPRK